MSSGSSESSENFKYRVSSTCGATACARLSTLYKLHTNSLDPRICQNRTQLRKNNIFQRGEGVKSFIYPEFSDEDCFEFSSKSIRKYSSSQSPLAAATELYPVSKNTMEGESNVMINNKWKSLNSLVPIQDVRQNLSWLAHIHVFNVSNLLPSLAGSKRNAYISISQGDKKLGKTSVNHNSSELVWDRALILSLSTLDKPLLFKFKCRQNLVKASLIASSHLNLDHMSTDSTYHRHLTLHRRVANDESDAVGVLRIHIKILKRKLPSVSSFERKTSSELKEGKQWISPKETTFYRKHSARSVSLTTGTPPELQMIKSLLGPLSSNLRTFEARYSGLIQSDRTLRPTQIYARRWLALESQAFEVEVITNELTKQIEFRSPRLCWPTCFFKESSALQFSHSPEPKLVDFVSATLQITVVSVCGLRGLHLSKMLKYQQGNQKNRGVVAAEMIACGKSLLLDSEKLSTFVQLQFDKERLVTKVRRNTYDPVWNQTFTFDITNESPFLIKLHLYNRPNYNPNSPNIGNEKIGAALLDISQLPLDITQRIEVELTGNNSDARLLLLVTMTGLTSESDQRKSLRYSVTYDRQKLPAVVIDSFPNDQYEEAFLFENEPVENNAKLMESKALDEQIIQHYSWKNSLHQRFDVGFLRVRVISATGLQSKNINGKAGPYCVVTLLNMRAQTQTVHKTLHPRWDRTFIFPVTDIHAAIEISLWHEDRSKPEFIGRLAIPLLRIRNNQQMWYALKDIRLSERAKGSILLEFFFVYNCFKAAWRTLQPPEEQIINSDEKGRLSKLHQEYRLIIQDHVARLKKIFKGVFLIGEIFDAICSWENPLHTSAALIGYILFVWNFQPYMLPLILLAVLFVNRYNSSSKMLGLLHCIQAFYGVGAANLTDKRPQSYILSESTERLDQSPVDMCLKNDLLDALDFEFPEEEEDVQKETKQIKSRIANILSILDDLPEKLDGVASFFERIGGIFRWSVPWITWLTAIFLVVLALILYFVPLRVLLIIIGTNRLTKRILRPSCRSTKEIFNVISRVPSKPEQDQYSLIIPKEYFSPQ